MPQIIREQAGFNGVAPNATATIDIPRTGQYQMLALEYGTATVGGPNEANTRAEILETRLKVNGKVQRRITGSELIDLNKFYANAFSDGWLPMFLAEPWRRTVQGENGLGWGMADIDSFQMEVDIGGATTPTLKLHTVARAGDVRMGLIKKIRKFNLPVTATGVNILNSLPRSDNYYALHAKSANITRLGVKRDQFEDVDAPVGLLNEIYKFNGLSPQTGWTHLAFDHTRQVTDVLEMAVGGVAGPRPVNDFRVEFDMSAAVGFDILTETLGVRD